MRTGKRIGNAMAIAVGFACVPAAVVAARRGWYGWSDAAILVALYFPTGLGITVGYHRLFAHKAFRTGPVVRYLLAALGGMAVQGPLLEWVSDHRKHHAHADKEGDPHSPHVGRSGLRGLWHAHAGWLFRTQGEASPERYAPDLLADGGLRLLDRAFGALVLLSFALPFALGALAGGTLQAALRALFWAGFVRIFVLHHVTFSVNSICHVFGARRFDIDDSAGNVSWLALPSLGESWHHNHHAFPASAAHGLLWWEIDLSALVIRGLRALHLAWEVVEVPVERQQARVCAR